MQLLSLKKNRTCQITLSLLQRVLKMSALARRQARSR